MLSLYHSNKKVSYKYVYYKVAYKTVIQVLKYRLCWILVYNRQLVQCMKAAHNVLYTKKHIQTYVSYPAMDISCIISRSVV